MVMSKTVVSGIVGILVACLIFASVVGYFEQVAFNTSPGLKLPPEAPPLGSLTVTVAISNLTGPLGVGCEAVITVIITSKVNMTNVNAYFNLSRAISDLPRGIEFISGNLTMWNGDLRANVSMVFTTKIKAIEVGYARIRVTAIWWYNGWLGYPAEDSLWILVQENSIQVSHEPITSPNVIVAEPGNGTLPLWPNGTSPLTP